MRFRLALTPQPVDVFVRTRHDPVLPPVDVPDVGLRWGQESDFVFLEKPVEEGGVPPPMTTISDLNEVVVVKGVESFREYENHVIEANGVPVEGIKKVTFFLGEHEEYQETRKVEGGSTIVQPVVITVEEYIDVELQFEVAGTRGEPHPPPTPVVDLDELYEELDGI